MGLAPAVDRSGHRACVVAAQSLFAEYDTFALPGLDHDLVPAPKPHPKRGRATRAVEPARPDPVHVPKAPLLVDVLPPSLGLLGQQPTLRAYLLHLPHSVHEREPAFDPGRLSNPGDHGRVAPGADRPRDPGLGVIVRPAHPCTVLAVPFGHRLSAGVVARFDPVDEDLPDRFETFVLDIEPLVFQNRIELRHRPVDPVHVPPRLERTEHEHGPRVPGRRLLDGRRVSPFPPRPHPTRVFECVLRLPNPRPCGPDRVSAHRAPANRFVEPDPRFAERGLRARERRSDPLHAPRPEDGGDLLAREPRPGLRKPLKDREPGPVPSDVGFVRFVHGSLLLTPDHVRTRPLPGDNAAARPRSGPIREVGRSRSLLRPLTPRLPSSTWLAPCLT